MGCSPGQVFLTCEVFLSSVVRLCDDANYLKQRQEQNLRFQVVKVASSLGKYKYLFFKKIS